MPAFIPSVCRCSVARVGLFSLALSTLLAAGCSTPADSQIIGQADQVNTTLAPAIEQDPQVNNYLSTLGRRIQSAARQLDSEHVGPKAHFNNTDNSWMFGPEIQFHLVNSKTLNAFTTGGHHVYVYNAAVPAVQNEDDLAAVHGSRVRPRLLPARAEGDEPPDGAAVRRRRGRGGWLRRRRAAERPAYAQAGAGLAMAVGQFVNMGFTRGDEAQADEWGFQFYTRAGWDPDHFGDFFQTMIDLGYDKTPADQSDHPTLASRVTAAKQRAAKLGPYATQNLQPDILTPDQFSQLKQVAQQVAARTPNDQQLQQAQQLLAPSPAASPRWNRRTRNRRSSKWCRR